MKGDDYGNDDKVHQDGNDHIKENTESVSQEEAPAGNTEADQPNESASQQEAPASNPGADDPSGGIADGNGGVSGSADVGSPVPNSEEKEQSSSESGLQQSTKDFVKGDGDSKTEGQEEARNAEGQGSAEAGGAATAAAGTGAAAAGTLAGQSDSTSAETSKDTNENSSSAGITDSADSTADTTTQNETMADTEQKDENSQPQYGEDEQKSERQEVKEQSSSGDNTGVGNKGPGQSKENRDAIPTAGGEKLGAQHWGESSKVPEVPPKRDSEAQQVSSGEGQPDRMLPTSQDNSKVSCSTD